MDAPPDSAHRPVRRAVVLGASMAGMLAAAVLAEHADEVLVLDRDELPAGPAPRPGLPQAHHVHLLWSGGVRVIEAIAPGLTRAWLDAGARQLDMPADLVLLTPHGWVRRGSACQYQLACSRDLLDATARAVLLTGPRIRVRTGVHAEDLLATGTGTGAGTRTAVRGVRVRDLATGAAEEVSATLVVDATGRGSRAPEWLERIGLPRVREESVDPGLVYASRLYRAPDGAAGFPAVGIQADPGRPVPGRMATLLPVEGGRWLVTLAGTRGAEPTREAVEFEAFARTARHPLVADLIADAEPLSEVRLSRSCSNRRRWFEGLRPWPAGFVVLGDAAAAFNPVYGQGMTVAAQSAAVLRTALRAHGLAAPRLARTVQRGVGRVVEVPWSITTGQDIRFPGATGRPAPFAARLTHGYVDRLSRTAMSSEEALRALFDVMSLAEPPTRLFRPRTVRAVLAGPAGPPPDGPPLTAAERSVGRPAVPEPAE
ncbi:pyridine nucleotide-disulfide oxidoreductase [Streptomyces venezuelae]|uniref:Pyridine nucleotide-disulfide oxidoreductase n=1 Tax=Streptomyces venezuelae TaxID=54571 RepID=A0A5P2D8U3_STRVZ|nr:FAD-dependent monooxygenase [Streptomyces venezuelae]QES51574.1 pyridine nucleotide-disulfide oxidoreductase [Streptomyces venezuelae]